MNYKIRIKVFICVLVCVISCLLYNKSNYKKIYADNKYDEEVTVGVGEKVKFEFVKGKDPADYKFIIENNKYAHITSYGNVYGYKKGKTVVNCYKKKSYEKNGNEAEVYKKIKVVVKKAPKKINIKTKKDYVFAGQKMKINVKLNNKYSCTTYKYKSSNSKICKITKNGMLIAKKKGKAKITVETYNGIKKSKYITVKSTKKLVALTFDDGPSENTKRLLDAMDKMDFHGTFFMVGTMISGNKDILCKMRDNGNELAIHAWNHGNLANMSKAEVIADMKRTAKLIKDYTDEDVTMMRPPYGSVNNTTIKALEKIDYPCILWNINIEDYLTNSSEVVYNNILNRVHPGAILLVHDSHSWSVDGVIKAMKKLKKEGYEFCTVTEFCEVKGLKLSGGKKIFGTSN